MLSKRNSFRTLSLKELNLSFKVMKKVIIQVNTKSKPINPMKKSQSKKVFSQLLRKKKAQIHRIWKQKSNKKVRN